MFKEWATKSKRMAIGLMSGTSLDGIDAAIVTVEGVGMNAKVELIGYYITPYDDELKRALANLCTLEHSNSLDISTMNFHLGILFAEAAIEACKHSGVSMDRIDYISSHGQTIWHQPKLNGEETFPVCSTLQIGDISVIAKQTGKIVIGDFRTADMAVGGQGAPLTPYADYILFKHEEIGRVVQNIGGIGNCAVIPASASHDEVIAFDTGPGNMVIDQAVLMLSKGLKRYDEHGEWAASGKINTALLDNMLQHPFFSTKPVKTTGREMFGKQYTSEWLAEAERKKLVHEDIIATFTALTAHCIAKAYEDFVFPLYNIDEIIVTGGGIHNATLLRYLEELLPNQRILTSDEVGVSGDAKEAVAFALLGDNFIHGIPNNLPRVTGAREATVMGKVALP